MEIATLPVVLAPTVKRLREFDRPEPLSRARSAGLLGIRDRTRRGSPVASGLRFDCLSRRHLTEVAVGVPWTNARCLGGAGFDGSASGAAGAFLTADETVLIAYTLRWRRIRIPLLSRGHRDRREDVLIIFVLTAEESLVEVAKDFVTLRG